MHTGEQYHAYIQSLPKVQQVRDRFQKMALDLLPEGADVLDFGAGTGIDAKTFADRGHRTFVYEPSEAMSGYLEEYCRDEIHRHSIVTVKLPLSCKVHAVTSNFAVLNHIEDQASLFQDLSRVVRKGGFVLANLLNPYYLGDARYGWWRSNVVNLMRNGHYPIPSESGIHRFAPRFVAQAAEPHFRLERLVPGGLRLATHPYMSMLFRRV